MERTQIQLQREEAEKVLLGSGWLSVLPPAFQQEVIRRSVLMRFAPEEYVYRMGDDAGGIYGLVSGNVAISSAPSHETPKMMQLGRPGAWTGEGSFITRQPRLIEVQAKVGHWMMHLPLDQMDKMAFQDAQAVRNFSMILVQTVHVLVQMVNDLQLVDPARRIAATLERASMQFSKELPITQAELGEMACATRRQVSIVLRDFSSKGWIMARYGRIIIQNAEALRAFSRSD